MYLPFFCLGIRFYTFYKNRVHNRATDKFERVFFLLFCFFLLYTTAGWPVGFVNGGMLLLFAAFVYRPAWLDFLNTKWLVPTGESSYFLYLIHENTGILLIYSFGAFLLHHRFVVPLAVTGSLTASSIAYTRYVERPASRWPKKWVRKNDVPVLLR